jgi:hypothetical protein
VPHFFPLPLFSPLQMHRLKEQNFSPLVITLAQH